MWQTHDAHGGTGGRLDRRAFGIFFAVLAMLAVTSATALAGGHGRQHGHPRGHHAVQHRHHHHRGHRPPGHEVPGQEVPGHPEEPSSGTVWLCQPGQQPDPCTAPLTTTVIGPNGSEWVEHAQPAQHAPIDCFYVYPTVSEQLTPNANLAIEPEETAIAEAQASRFSQVCNVYAPVYPQSTLAELNGLLTEAPPPADPFPTVLAAFEEYLARYNDGRGFVLIGHSQGSGQLEKLIATAIEGHPSVQSRMISALVIGGGVTVPNGQVVGGTFKETPLCQAAFQIHCVVAWSTYYQEPPAGPSLGRTLLPGQHVACVNPGQLIQDEDRPAPLDPYEQTTRFPGQIGTFQGQSPTADTPWVSTPGEYSAQCHVNEGAGWLQLTPQGTPRNPPEFVPELLGPAFGLHLFDINIALGNEVGMVALQTQHYLLESHFGH
jgi:hypothetical protein